MRTSLLAIPPLLLAACGSGGGGGGGGPAPQTLVIASDPMLDGMVRSDGSVLSSNTDLVVGDIDMEDPIGMFPPTSTGERGFVSFGVSLLPSGATLVDATLTLFQFYGEGDPYGDGHGNVGVDHLDYGTSLDSGDYAATALTSDVGVLSNDAVHEAKSLDVTAQVAADLAAGRFRSQFRIRFNGVDSDSDGTADRAGFYSGNSTVSPPVLTVRYTTP